MAELPRVRTGIVVRASESADEIVVQDGAELFVISRVQVNPSPAAVERNERQWRARCIRLRAEAVSELTRPFPWQSELDPVCRRHAALADLGDELAHAERKFPAGAQLVEALCEELGEAARDPSAAAPRNREWLQVACVAMRAYMGGIPDFAGAAELVDSLKALEAPARLALGEVAPS